MSGRWTTTTTGPIHRWTGRHRRPSPRRSTTLLLGWSRRRRLLTLRSGLRPSLRLSKRTNTTRFSHNDWYKNRGKDITSFDYIQYVSVWISHAQRCRDMFILTNLPKKLNGKKVTNLYLKRWTIENAFQELAEHLNSEINTLGYPKAAHEFAKVLRMLALNVNLAKYRKHPCRPKKPPQKRIHR